MNEDDADKAIKNIEKYTLETKALLEALRLALKSILGQLDDQDERIKGIESYLAMKEADGKK